MNTDQDRSRSELNGTPLLCCSVFICVYPWLDSVFCPLFSVLFGHRGRMLNASASRSAPVRESHSRPTVEVVRSPAWSVALLALVAVLTFLYIPGYMRVLVRAVAEARLLARVPGAVLRGVPGVALAGRGHRAASGGRNRGGWRSSRCGAGLFVVAGKSEHRQGVAPGAVAGHQPVRGGTPARRVENAPLAGPADRVPDVHVPAARTASNTRSAGNSRRSRRSPRSSSCKRSATRPIAKASSCT